MKSPIKWTGGKAREIKHFEDLIPSYSTYVEPFFGGGALYWHLKPEYAIINDINEHLINFYFVLKDNYNSLMNVLNGMDFNKDYFDKIVKKLNSKEYDNQIEQAAIFYYLNKTAFSGKWRVNSQGKYNNTWGNYKKPNYKILDNKYSDILHNTSIMNEDYKTVMNSVKYDKDTFVFLDPPYLDCDAMYTANQSFENIYDYIYKYIQECKCKIMLVVKADEYIINLFKNNVVREYEVRYSHNAKSEKSNKHIVITNY